uniref:Bestrophin homolog n=1 Tax=Angiostrongylus cantonensis TaxID=6313 RepID=A0A0K0D7E2_ANGCA
MKFYTSLGIVLRISYELFIRRIYLTGISGFVYAYLTNPSEWSMLDDLCGLGQTMRIVPVSIHNNESGKLIHSSHDDER